MAQKSRINRIRGGDSNSNFFHKMTLVRHCDNKISSLTVDNSEEVEDPRSIREVFKAFFANKWGVGTAGGILNSPL